jgi:hypothetical protein
LRAKSWKLLLQIGDALVVEVFVYSGAIHTQVAPFYALYFLQFPSGMYCMQLNTRTWYLWRNVSEVMTLPVFPSWWLVPTFPEPWQRSSIYFCNQPVDVFWLKLWLSPVHTWWYAVRPMETI